MRPVDSLHGTVMVTRDGSVVADLAGGLADIEAGVPCTSGTRFQLCSVSKQFTAAAVLLLVESGSLDLREPVDRWLPETPPQWRQVTLHHLLSHTAGIPHWLEAPGLDPAEPMSISGIDSSWPPPEFCWFCFSLAIAGSTWSPTRRTAQAR